MAQQNTNTNRKIKHKRNRLGKGQQLEMLNYAFDNPGESSSCILSVFGKKEGFKNTGLPAANTFNKWRKKAKDDQN